MGFRKEFKEFIMRGNVMDMAVGVIIGGAFSMIVSSLVDDMIMPVISLITGKIDFTNLFIALDGGDYKTIAAARDAGASVVAYGSFIQNVIQFRRNMCKINCSVDVLMSYKNLILNSSGDVTQDVNQYSKESRYNVSEKTNLQTVEFTSPFDTTGSIIMVTTSGGVY